LLLQKDQFEGFDHLSRVILHAKSSPVGLNGELQGPLLLVRKGQTYPLGVSLVGQDPKSMDDDSGIIDFRLSSF
jgi:hypothetical protein